jgi:hypothetical protein
MCNEPRRPRSIANVRRKADKTADRDWVAAYDRMVARLEEGASLGGLKVDREDLYGGSG